MKRIVHCLIVVYALLLTVQPAHAGNGLTQVTDRVYSYLDVKDASPTNSFGANAGIIIGDRGIIVIDTLISSKQAQGFIEDIRKITDKQILFVINTHYHLDHSFGNSDYAKLGATIICHQDCAEEMHQKADANLAKATAYGLTEEDMVGTAIAYPAITFTERMTVDAGGVTVELIHVAPSHSTGSILVRVPEDEVVFAGDILFTDFYPYMGDCDVNGWQHNLDALAALGAKYIIPGHGPLSDKDDVLDLKNYLSIFDKKARELVKGSHTLEEMETEMKKILPPRPQAEWLIGASLQAKYLRDRDKGKQ